MFRIKSTLHVLALPPSLNSPYIPLPRIVPRSLATSVSSCFLALLALSLEVARLVSALGHLCLPYPVGSISSQILLWLIPSCHSSLSSDTISLRRLLPNYLSILLFFVITFCTLWNFLIFVFSFLH